MNLKKILLAICITLAIVTSICVVSAGMFDFGANSQEIGGIKFDIPGDYKEVSAPDNDALEMKFKGMKDVETKYFEFDQSDGMSIKPNQLSISVISDSGVKLDDINKFKNGIGEEEDTDDFENATISDKTGLALNTQPKDMGGGHMSPEVHEFYYMEDGKLVHVELYGWSPYVSVEMLGDIIG